MFKKIIPFILILSILFICVLPSFAFADGTSSVWRTNQLGWMMLIDLCDGVTDLGQTTFEALGSVFTHNAICAVSQDHLHHASNFTSYGSGEDNNGAYVKLKCDYCADIFKCYSSDVLDSYNETVKTDYPLNGYSSDGGFLWYPTFDDVGGSVDCGTSSGYLSIPIGSPVGYSVSSSDGASVSVLTPRSFSFEFHSYTENMLSTYGFSSNFKNYPVSGDYSYLDIPFLYLSFNSYPSGAPVSSSFSLFGFSDGTRVLPYTFTGCYSGRAADNISFKFSPGKELRNSNEFFSNMYSRYNIYSKDIYYEFTLPAFRVVPDVSPTASYQPESRFGSLTLDLSDDSLTNIYEDIIIINEGDNTLYNPVTNTTYDMTGWNYDYSTHSYDGYLNVSPDVDGHFHLEFGLDDLNLTIGDDEYSYKYATPSHTHEYTSVITTEATCTGLGVLTYTCDCGDTYTEVIPALGHDYVLDRIEPMTYILDDSSLVCPDCDSDDVTAVLAFDKVSYNCTCHDCGYTFNVAGTAIAGRDVYVCSRCGDIYYNDDGYDLDNSDVPFWKWLQRWLIRFKDWLGEKLDSLPFGSASDDSSSVPSVSVEDDTITFADDEGEEQEVKIGALIKKFGFIKDLYTIGKTLVSVVSADAASAYEYDFSKLESADDSSGGDTSNSSAPLRSAPSRSGVLSSGGAPSLTINLGAAQSHYGFSYGGTVEFLDLSWYAPYKSTVDGLLSGFLWVFFLWKLFSKAPGIISGAGMDSSKVEDISNGERRRK